MRCFVLFVMAAFVIGLAGCGGSGGAPAGYSVDSNGWVTTPTGLKRKDTQIGTGLQAREMDAVNITYTGWLESLSEANPFISETTTEMIVGEGKVVIGLDQGIVGMKTGGTCELIVPASLGYGLEGTDDIPGNAVLHFRVKVNSVTQDFAMTSDGLQYRYEAFGEGAKSTKGQTITVNYEGRLEDGTVFDSSYKEGREPFKFKLGAGEVIKGWDEGLLGVKKGAKIQLVIPPELGYGDHDQGSIPANSTLYFTVEVLSID